MVLKDFSELVKMAQKQGQRRIIAIDGRCGSGKSFLGNKLAEILHADIVHMDDFYLRKEQRTPERYRTPGENIDHERVEDFLKAWCAGNPFTYQKFDHRTFEPGQTFFMYPAKILVAEGSYSMHPSLRKYYDMTVFVRCTEETRQKRLKAREGANYQNFVTRWIPLEEMYFRTFDIEHLCDVIFDTENTEI